MIYLIRTIESRESGSVEHRDNQHSGDVITIGRATDQDIQLMESEVALNHARIALQGKGSAHIKSTAAVHPITINDKVVASSPLNVGDTVSIGASSLKVIKPPAGFDFAITLERAEADRKGDLGALGMQFDANLSPTSFGKRSWSWLLFILIITAFLVLPVSGLLNENVKAVLHSTPLPDDGTWETGPLIPAHQSPEIASDCNQCHAEPFQMVQNEQCVACHSNANQHTDENIHFDELASVRCASCHKEHNEPATLVRQDDDLCVACHLDLSSGLTETQLANASNFGTDHPPFKLSMLLPAEGDGISDWQIERVEQVLGLQESSNLKFDHTKHLSPEGIDSPEGEEILQCSSCHALDDRSMLMAPITMEGSCRRCHTLVFDAGDPQREVPHGDPVQVILSLEEYYARVLLENSAGQQEVSNTPIRRRLRQSRPAESDVGQSNRLGILNLVRDRAERAASQLFEETTCKLCHEININNESQELLSRWVVEPVRITPEWLPKHDFDHYSHRTEDCSRCHAANESTSSTDVLIPAIEVCRECHNEGGNRLATPCASCHSFHLNDQASI